MYNMPDHTQNLILKCNDLFKICFRIQNNNLMLEFPEATINQH